MAPMQGLRELAREIGRHHFEHKHGCTSILKLHGEFVQCGCGNAVAALYAIAPQCMHGLWREAQVRTCLLYTSRCV